MKCPNDQTTLVISERQNIEIDYCPECRGVWLDRGELDKMLERSANITASPSIDAREPYRHEQQHRDFRSNDQHYKHKKKESFLGDLFDF